MQPKTIDDVTLALNPQVACVRVSASEFLVRAGHLEGYSIVVRDDGSRVAERIFDPSGPPTFTTADLRSVDHEDNADELRNQVLDLLRAGVLVEAAGGDEHHAAWTAFCRFGTVPEPALVRPIAIVGDELAATIADELAALGLRVVHRSPSQLDAIITSGEPVGVASVDDLDAASADAESADAAGAASRWHRTGDGAALVLAFDTRGVLELQQLNRHLVDLGVPFLPVVAAGAFAAVGPYVHPGQSACYWEFETQRARSMFDHSHYGTFVAASDARPAPSTWSVTCSRRRRRRGSSRWRPPGGRRSSDDR